LLLSGANVVRMFPSQRLLSGESARLPPRFRYDGQQGAAGSGASSAFCAWDGLYGSKCHLPCCLLAVAASLRGDFLETNMQKNGHL
jgi:hypothetical protein